jgi:HEPN domain-containing protein
MALDPVRVEDTRAWLIKVAGDLRGAEVDLAAIPPLLEDLAFHCQQAVEKALKAFLIWHDEPFRKTHDLRLIGGQCVAIDPTLRELVDRAAPLTDYAWEFRYPGDEAAPTLEQATEALELAREVVAAVHARLPAQTHP